MSDQDKVEEADCEVRSASYMFVPFTDYRYCLHN